MGWIPYSNRNSSASHPFRCSVVMLDVSATTSHLSGQPIKILLSLRTLSALLMSYVESKQPFRGAESSNPIVPAITTLRWTFDPCRKLRWAVPWEASCPVISCRHRSQSADSKWMLDTWLSVIIVACSSEWEYQSKMSSRSMGAEEGEGRDGTRRPFDWDAWGEVWLQSWLVSGLFLLQVLAEFGPESYISSASVWIYSSTTHSYPSSHMGSFIHSTSSSWNIPKLINTFWDQVLSSLLKIHIRTLQWSSISHLHNQLGPLRFRLGWRSLPWTAHDTTSHFIRKHNQRRLCPHSTILHLDSQRHIPPKNKPHSLHRPQKWPRYRFSSRRPSHQIPLWRRRRHRPLRRSNCRRCVIIPTRLSRSQEKRTENHNSFRRSSKDNNSWWVMDLIRVWTR